MTETVRPNRYGNQSEPPQEPNAADDFARFAGDYLLPQPAEQAAEAHDAPPALTEADTADVLERLHPGRVARAAAEADKAASPARFGAWAAERFVPSDQTADSQSLANFLNRPRNH